MEKRQTYPIVEERRPDGVVLLCPDSGQMAFRLARRGGRIVGWVDGCYRVLARRWPDGR